MMQRYNPVYCITMWKGYMKLNYCNQSCCWRGPNSHTPLPHRLFTPPHPILFGSIHRLLLLESKEPHMIYAPYSTICNSGQHYLVKYRTKCMVKSSILPGVKFYCLFLTSRRKKEIPLGTESVGTMVINM